MAENEENKEEVVEQVEEKEKSEETKLKDTILLQKEQLDELQKEFSEKSIFSNKKIYIINHADRLNKSAANSILKFLEEPEENIIAILITDNIYQLLDTIVSRCQIISFSKEHSISSLSFIEKIKKFTSIPIELQDERLSTIIATNILLKGNVSREKRKGVVDKVAATIILQSYLDKKSKNK